MHKKLIGVGIGIALLASPVLASAQTTGSSNPSIIATLEQLVATLTQELQQLLAGKSSTQVTPTQNTTVSSSSTTNSCAAYANLQKGDTDAATNGEVTQLQSFLGISPTTGYYGAQTSIAYQNKCGNLGNSQPTSIAGMSQYTDSSFGFSFWYPSSWTVKETDAASTFTITDSTNTTIIQISEITPVNGAISNWIDNYDSEKYYFDSTVGEWTYARTSGSQVTTSPANVSLNTMGGLHLLSFPDQSPQTDVIVPLSATKFVTVDAVSNTNIMPLAQTIVATNPAVAIPVSTNQQTADIEAEASAYGDSSTSASDSSAQTVSVSNQYNQMAATPLGSNTWRFSFTGGFAEQQQTYWLDLGDGTKVAITCATLDSNNSLECDQFAPVTHTYSQSGTYQVNLDENFVGAGSQTTSSLLTLTVTN